VEFRVSTGGGISSERLDKNRGRRSSQAKGGRRGRQGFLFYMALRLETTHSGYTEEEKKEL